jgi:hypothetical protein
LRVARKKLANATLHKNVAPRRVHHGRLVERVKTRQSPAIFGPASARTFERLAIRVFSHMSRSAARKWEGRRMTRQIANVLYWVGVIISLPFVVLVGVSLMRMFSEGLEPKYVSSTFLGVAGAAFSYAVGFLLRHMLLQNEE